MSSAAVGERCLQLALRQRGLITSQQARHFGMSSSSLHRRVSTGRWLTIYPGVHRLKEHACDWEQSLLAACLWGGENVVVSHRAACRLHSLAGVEAPVEITVLGTRRSIPGLLLHRTQVLDPRDRTSIRGIPTTSATRTLIDLGAVCELSVVEGALETAFREGLTTPWYLVERLEQLGRRGRRGTTKLRRLLRQRDPRLAPTESELETMVWQLIRRHSLPVPARQVGISDARGFIGRADFAYVDLRLVIEAVGATWHLSRSRWLTDTERRNRLTLAGWRVLEIPWLNIVKTPRRVAERIREATLSPYSLPATVHQPHFVAADPA